MRRLILPVFIVLCLSGCASPQQQAQKQQAKIDQMVQEFGPACSRLGYAVDSDPWRNCVVQLATNNDIQKSGASTSIFGSWGNWGRRGQGSSVGVGVGLGR